MEKEIEIKFKVDENIINKLKNIKLESYEEVDEYFITKEMLENNIFLRIRKKKGKSFLQLKHVTTKETKDCYEADEVHIELTEENYKKMREILKRTFPFNFIVKKIRSKGFLNGCEICLDKVERLGNFLEIEGQKEKILEICKQFNLDLEKRVKEKGYANMMANKLNI